MGVLKTRKLLKWRINTEQLTRSEVLITRYSRLYLFMALFQSFCLFSINIAIIIVDRFTESIGKKITIYSFLYIVVAVHQAWLVWDGVRHTNIFEIYGFVGLNFTYIFFGSLQLYDITSHQADCLVILASFSLAVQCLSFLLGIGFTVGISNQYRWEMFKTVGNNAELRQAWFLQLWFPIAS